MNKEINLITVDSEIGAGTRGSSLGIGAMKVVAQNKNDNFFSKYKTINIKTENHVLNLPNETKYANNIHSIKKVFERTSKQVKEVIENNKIPLVLSGDHSTAASTIAGIKMAHPNKTLGVVWIDAHADLHSPFTTPSGNMHGMPLAIAINEDNLQEKINNPNEEVISAWENLKNISGIKSKINPKNLVFVGVRDTEKPEDRLIQKLNIKNHTVEEVRNKGVEKIFNEITHQLNSCDMIYVSFDVDSMDCEIVSRGTGTPVENGLTPNEANQLLNKLAGLDKTCCMEVVEINPCLDNKINKMAEVAFELTSDFVNILSKK